MQDFEVYLFNVWLNNIISTTVIFIMSERMEEWTVPKVQDFLFSQFPENKKDLKDFLCLHGIVFHSLDKETCRKYTDSIELADEVYFRKEKFKKNICDGNNNSQLIQTDSECKHLTENNCKASPKRRGRPKKAKRTSGLKESSQNETLPNKRKINVCQFIRDLLNDPKYRGSLIEWVNEEEGVFKFVQSQTVAKLWGERRQNPNMNFEKFSRAMRYYYKQKILKPRHGRLIYQFGKPPET